MSNTLSGFLSRMDRYRHRVPLDELVEALEQLEVTVEDVAEFAQFGDATYRRNLMHAGPGYQALILCWRNGQRSPIHDHRGSSCGVRVLRGTMTETVFDRAPNGQIYATHSRTLDEGVVCGSQDSDIHQVSNLQADGRDLITMHIYSPALLLMGTYSLTDTLVREFREPIYEFAHGDGI